MIETKEIRSLSICSVTFTHNKSLMITNSNIHERRVSHRKEERAIRARGEAVLGLIWQLTSNICTSYTFPSSHLWITRVLMCGSGQVSRLGNQSLLLLHFMNLSAPSALCFVVRERTGSPSLLRRLIFFVYEWIQESDQKLGNALWFLFPPFVMLQPGSVSDVDYVIEHKGIYMVRFF